MAKYGFYGVYGYNGAGIYNNWTKVEKGKEFIKGFKTKKFPSIYQAHEYIVNGLTVEYKVLKPDQVDHSIINSTTNWFFNIDDLRLDIADDKTIKQDKMLIKVLERV